MTYIVMNNQIYGLTTGQISPTSSLGMTTKSTPFWERRTASEPAYFGDHEWSNLCRPRLQRRCKHLSELIQKGIQHKGFSIFDCFSPCVTFNLTNTHDFFKERVKKWKMRSMIRAVGACL
ncbi:MAG: hypothetical protein Ct9H300mP11_10510 [Chloroflexota bacterium]|nr:MAG: hypothetical protein Ct9H300mP11_10510 [Chloroflexota bacterium]